MRRNAIAIDLGGTFIKYGVVNDGGEILWENKVATKSHSREALLNQLVNCVRDAETHHTCSCVGIGSPGLVDHGNGIILGGAPQLDNWVQVALAEFIYENTSLPTFVDNDANLMGLGEYKYGPNKDLNNLVFLTIGTGIGGALIINRQLYRGGFFSGGEVGYIPFARHGKEGFWEDFGSTGAMIRYYREVASVDKDTKVNGKTILKGVNEGDSYAIKAFDEHMEVLGTGLAGIICILNPEKIIIGGGISESGSFYIESLRASVQKHTAKECLGQVVLEAASLGNKAGFLGASYLALEALDNVQD